jgi:DNA-binding transcriptional MerR regulator
MEIISLESIKELFSGDPDVVEKVATFYKEMTVPRFHIKEVGISSKAISDWTKLGLLNDEFQKGKWREFSFIEAIWVKFIEELKFFGMPIEGIKGLKEALFPTKASDIKEYFSKIEEADSKNYFKNTQEHFDEAFAGSDEEIEKTFAEIKFSAFGSLIVAAFMLRLNLAFVLDDSQGYFVNLGKPLNDENALNMEGVFKDMIRKSFAIVNVSSLFGKFFDNDKLEVNADFYFAIMDTDEREVITAIRSGNYKQIIIKMEDGSITQLRLGKKQDEDLIRKISRILKKGDYQEIHLNVNDGNLTKLDVTDIVKIKK